MTPEVKIFSDWWANPNPGPGWYGVILQYRDVKKELLQWYTQTTNNRMELLWAITGLQSLTSKSKVTIYTDSQYTINGIEKWWAQKWKSNNWFRKWSQKAVNHDLWEIFLDLTTRHEVNFEWVKWHNGHIENERCDELATLAMNKDNLIHDEGFIEEEKQKPLSQQTIMQDNWDATGEFCRKCDWLLVEKKPKHTKKTLEKKYFYEYYHHCPDCKTNYMLQEAKRDIKDLRL